MKNFREYIYAAFFILTSVAAACGSETIGAPSQQPSIECPAQQPPDNGKCAVKYDGTQCWYGDDPRPDCRVRLSCMGGKWEKHQRACPPIDNAGCPSSPDLEDAGLACVVPMDAPDFCAYEGNVYCQCQWDVGEQYIGNDAGLHAEWTCQRPKPDDCPPTAPNPGTTCSHEGATCSYMSYGTKCMPYYFSCRDGVWQFDGQKECPGPKH